MLISGESILSFDKSLIALMVIFFLEYLVVKHFFLQPLNKVMGEREKDVRDAAVRHEDALARFTRIPLDYPNSGPVKETPAELPLAGDLSQEFAHQVTEFIDQYRPALEALSKK